MKEQLVTSKSCFFNHPNVYQNQRLIYYASSSETKVNAKNLMIVSLQHFHKKRPILNEGFVKVTVSKLTSVVYVFRDPLASNSPILYIVVFI